MPAHVHIEGCRLRAQQVIMQGGDRDAAFSQLGHDGRNLCLGEHEIAHHHGHIALWPERQPRAEGECGFEFDAIKRDMQIGARQPNTINAAGHLRAGLAEGSGDLAPVGFRGRARYVRRDERACENGGDSQALA